MGETEIAVKPGRTDSAQFSKKEVQNIPTGLQVLVEKTVVQRKDKNRL